MEVSNEQEAHIEDAESVETLPQTNGSVEEKVRTPCEALPGWSKVVVTRKTGNSAGKSDVYYFSPTGKKVRSKPEIEKLLFLTDGEIKDLSKFDYRTGTFVERTTTRASRKRKQQATDNIDQHGMDLVDFTMSSVPQRQTTKLSNGLEKFGANDLNGIHNGLAANGSKVGLVPPRQLYWETRLQNMNGKNGLVDFDIFADVNGGFRSLLLSIVKTLKMERDLANKKPQESERNDKKSKQKPLKITKADIRKQEKQVIKARRELAKAITEYETLKYTP